LIGATSADADLTIIGFRQEQLTTEGSYRNLRVTSKLGNVLFVNANKKKEIQLKHYL
jgi:hypothetical protein